jgi:23S rRNA (adenine2503-C2)-methyltransferase
MPVNLKYPLAEVFDAVDKYIAKKRRKVMFEYLLIKDVNDSEAHARELASLLHKPLYFVNLIPYNPTEFSPPMEGGKQGVKPRGGHAPFRGGVGKIFTPSDTQTVQKFKTILLQSGIQATERFRFGQDIKAACGQLVT